MDRKSGAVAFALLFAGVCWLALGDHTPKDPCAPDANGFYSAQCKNPPPP